MLKQSAFFCVNLLVMQVKHKYQKALVINHGFSLERFYKHCWRPLDCIPPYISRFHGWIAKPRHFVASVRVLVARHSRHKHATESGCLTWAEELWELPEIDWSF